MIRTAQFKDIRKILSVIKNTPELHGSAEGEGIYCEDYVKKCINDKKMSLVLVAEYDKKFAGFLNAEVWKDKKYSFLIDFVILPEFRSMGFGTELYEYYENYCKNKGLKTILALVNVSNIKMQKFCKKLGLEKGYKFYQYEKRI